ncbi:unnamed protein product [Adineta steineri]|uniref:Methyltransferase domain-containing protein n=1 Tax=Adineta steineri TaxID=433720 RepID=A0A815ZBF5_9BILA|nr:unnamed protein product [Adineta steineri]CAF1581108.1 unnamed protein product [Adineta steineri]
MTKDCLITGCKKQAATYCYHCSQDLCTSHSTEHKEWIQGQLLPIINDANTMHEHFHHCDKDQTMATLQCLTDVREQLDHWRSDCYHHIDSVYDQAQRQLALILEKHNAELTKKTTQNVESLKTIRRELGELLSEGNIAYRQIDKLKKQINEIKRNEQERINDPDIRIITQKLDVEKHVDIIWNVKPVEEELPKQRTTKTASSCIHHFRSYSSTDSDEENRKQRTTKKPYTNKKPIRPSMSTSQKSIDKCRICFMTFPKRMTQNDRIKHLLIVMSEQAIRIASCCLHDPEHFFIQVAQTEHRLKLAQIWSIQPGSNVLEIGCGQGDCTAVLASLVGSLGHVTGIDPGDLSYGAPYTLGQAQEHLKNSQLGAQITFKQTEVQQFLSDNLSMKYDVAVLAHSIWYFASPDILQDILQALKGRVQRVCIAEYALSTTSNNAFPHILSVLAQNTLFLRDPTWTTNIRTLLSPIAISEIIKKIGFHLVTSTILTPAEDLLDGEWETNIVLSNDFLQAVNQKVVHINEQVTVCAIRDAMISAIETLKLQNKKISTMDVWTAVFSVTV